VSNLRRFQQVVNGYILLVDDMKNYCNLVCKKLCSLGYRVDVANDKDTAFNLLKDRYYNLNFRRRKISLTC
jgi:CheY-like chemotaxis protein